MMLKTIERTNSSPVEETDIQASRATVSFLLDHAYTIWEVRAAQNAWRNHLAAYPQDTNRSFSHFFGHAEDAANVRLEQARQMGLSHDEQEQREILLKEAVGLPNDYVTQDEINVPAIERYRDGMLQIIARLQQWLERYPGDPTVQERIKGLHTGIQEAEFFRAIANAA